MVLNAATGIAHTSTNCGLHQSFNSVTTVQMTVHVRVLILQKVQPIQ